MVAAHEDTHDAAFVRLNEARCTLQVAQASGWRPYLVAAARQEVDEALATFRIAQEALRQARVHADDRGSIDLTAG